MHPEVVFGGVLFLGMYCLILFLLSLMARSRRPSRPQLCRHTVPTPLFDVRPDLTCALLGNIEPPDRFPMGGEDCA